MGRLALRGAVNSATVMDGPIEKIRDEIRKRLWQLGRRGGYFCNPDQDMPYPQEHLDVFQEVVAEYGAYPLDPYP